MPITNEPSDSVNMCDNFFTENWLTEDDIPESIQDLHENFINIFKRKMAAKSLRSDIIIKMSKSTCYNFAHMESNCDQVKATKRVFKAESKNFHAMEIAFCEMIDNHTKNVLIPKLEDEQYAKCLNRIRNKADKNHCGGKRKEL